MWIDLFVAAKKEFAAEKHIRFFIAVGFMEFKDHHFTELHVNL